MTRARVIAGAGVTLYINGLPWGQASEVKITSSTPRKTIFGIDSLEGFELAQTTTKVSGSIKYYRTIGDAGAEGANMTSRFEDLSQEKYIVITLVERTSDTIIFHSNTCSVSSQTLDIPAKGIVTGVIDFEALDWSNEIKSAKT